MKKKYFLLLIMSFFLIGCQSEEIHQSTDKIENVEKTIENPPEEKPALACNPCMYAPKEWGEPSDWAYPEKGEFWAKDLPTKVGPTAFGILPHNPLTNINLEIKQIELDTEIPTIPHELPVYIQGSYPSHHKELLSTLHPYHEVLEYHPPYSGIYFAGMNPLTEEMDHPNKNKIEQKAREILGKLIKDDSDNPTTIKHEDSSWTVIFYRYMNGYKVYVDKPLRVGFDSEGRALWMEGRRRPILEESEYPIRSPKKALEDLKKGNWLHLYITDLSPAFNENIDQFIIKEIEIAYHEQHPGYPKQVLQPYYIFRNQNGQALYVPAIDDPFVE